MGTGPRVSMAFSQMRNTTVVCNDFWRSNHLLTKRALMCVPVMTIFSEPLNGVHLQYSVGFRQLRDPDGFDAKWGPTTCERRHDCYNFTTDAQCNWNGGVWPFETSKVCLLHSTSRKSYLSSLLEIGAEVGDASVALMTYCMHGFA